MGLDARTRRERLKRPNSKYLAYANEIRKWRNSTFFSRGALPRYPIFNPIKAFPSLPLRPSLSHCPSPASGQSGALGTSFSSSCFPCQKGNSISYGSHSSLIHPFLRTQKSTILRWDEQHKLCVSAKIAVFCPGTMVPVTNAGLSLWMLLSWSGKRTKHGNLWDAASRIVSQFPSSTCSTGHTPRDCSC